ncbi:hypothetical protein G6F46_000479 [Rhizopus delemar]|nr:hypothetical protein G6F55_000173 [Rhizopus delemar]KAG1553254.1 hypothetical protein G6F51_000713 [Rhizopus arrhizus]KAG1505277.1 hypothetical protein G6F54_000423 [Rhizopus delemar]KAG1518636.1 hypothetical protein G6F53_000427 [Rhizopus delemar]KAG1527040.1 hypothetical protein G6F52_001895 [Rhizopus delemar]
MEDEVILACRRIQMMLYDDLIDEDVVEKKIGNIKSSSNNQNVKAVAKLLSSVLRQCTVEKSEQKHETSLIIESLQPFIFSCVISRIKDIKFEWMTYHLVPPSGHPNNQTMLPDLVLYADPISKMNYELFFVEVKRKGNFANGHLESDIVKLGKEMQIAINKLILRKVKCPEVVGLLVEGYVATAYKMDLKFNGQYRMVEISKFNFTCNSVGDIMLVPTIMEKLYQIQAIISETLQSLYNSFDDIEESEDTTSLLQLLVEVLLQ